MSTARQQANDLLALLRRERDTLAEFLVALAQFDRERSWERLGHASLFAFLVKDLGLSNGAAAYRRAAVDLVQRFPQVLETIRDGRLCLTTVFELSKVITGENASEVLPRFFGTSRRDAKNVVAELAPEPAPRPRSRSSRRLVGWPTRCVPTRRMRPDRAPPTSGARSGSGTAGGARGRWSPEASAGPPTGSSSITWTGSPSGRVRPSTRADSSAVPTSSSPPGGCTATT
jgi:hypothetical protein